MLQAKKRVNQAEENDVVTLPKWMYVIAGTLFVAAVGAFIGFCSWLSLTAIEQGQHLQQHSNELRHINKSLASIDDKIIYLSDQQKQINELQNQIELLRILLKDVATSKQERGEDGYYY